MSLPYIPKDAPFSEGQRQWFAGFFAGLNTRILASGKDSGGGASQGAAAKSLHILYGTQTGNAETLANETATLAAQHGMQAHVIDMGDFDIAQLPAIERLLIVCSTYGEGEQPDPAQPLWDAAVAEGAPKIENTHFSVLALGDTNYDKFCQAGKDWDRRLEELGGKRVQDRVDCDVDFEEPFEEWVNAVLPAITAVGAQPPAGAASAAVATTQTAAPAASKWTKKNPFLATMKRNLVLTKAASTKETRHYEISLEGSDIHYEVGDALGVQPTNCPELVENIVKALGLKGDEEVLAANGETATFAEALFTDYEIKTPNRELLQAIADRSENDEFKATVAGDKEALSAFMWGRDIIDLLLEYPKAKFTAEGFIALLKKIQPRLYSISSSINKHPDEVHLTVASVRYESHGNVKKGVASTFLADRIGDEVKIPVYIHPNKAFGVPADDTLPMIMVGPGTGVAPFRAFLEEREVRGATGKNWLFFGERNASADFFYEDELSAMQKSGLLTKLDLAFSRDQEKKIYVQDRMRENAKELFAWLEEGGYFFVCGDASRMAKDVDTALHDIIAEQGSMSIEAAGEYVAKLKKDKRYVRDVY